MPELIVNGVKLHFLDVGQGPPVLLLHAFPLSSAAFAPQVEALSPHFRFIVPDLRGFGASGLTAGPTLMRTLASDALAILDSLQVESAVVGGVSMGGYATLELLRMDPSRVRGLVLIDTQCGADDESARQRRESTAQALEGLGAEVLLQTLLPKLLSPEAPPGVREKVAEWIRTVSPQGAAAAQRGMALRSDAREILSRFAGPSLVIVGERDELTPVAKAKEMASLLAGSTLVTIPNAGHLANLEAPEVVNVALARFLQSIGAESAHV